MFPRKSLRVASLIAIVLCASACGTATPPGAGAGSSGSAAPGGSIPITLVVDQTGSASANGIQFEQGVRTAVAELNGSDALLGMDFDLTVKDAASNPATASTVTAAAVQAGTSAILGFDSSTTALAAVPIAQRAQVPVLVDSPAAGILDIGEYVYSVTSPQTSGIDAYAAHIAKSVKTANIIYANDNATVVQYFEGITEALKNSGVSVLDSVGTPYATTDFSALVTRLMNGDPDAVVIADGGSQVPAIIKALRTAGYDGLLFGSPGAAAESSTLGPEADGFQFNVEWVPESTNPETAAFVAEYAKLYPDNTPTFTVVDGYDAVKMLALAVSDQKKTDRAGILAGLRAVADAGFDGPPGALTFGGTDNRQLSAPGLIVEVSGGKISVVQQ